MIPLCLDQGVGLIPWSPLARGFLAGNRTHDKGGPTKRARSDGFAHQMYYQPDDFAVVERVVALAERHGTRPAQIAQAWMVHKPGITAPIIGASQMPHLEQAVAALGIELSDEELAFLEQPYRPHLVLGQG